MLCRELVDAFEEFVESSDGKGRKCGARRLRGPDGLSEDDYATSRLSQYSGEASVTHASLRPSLLSLTQQMPTSRWNSAACMVDGKFYLFGGEPLTNALYSYCDARDEWTRSPLVGRWPRARHACTFTAFLSNQESGGSAFLFGGAHKADFLGDAWLFTPSNLTAKWVLLDTGNCAPAPRSFHAAVSTPTGIAIFGGKGSNNTLLGDFWVLDGSAWQKLCTNGDTITPRCGHSMCWDGSSIYLFGGYQDIGVTTNELFSIAASDGEWFCRQVIACQPARQIPPSRAMHTMTTTECGFVLTGGRNEGESIHDTVYHFNCRSEKWTRVSFPLRPVEPDVHDSCLQRSGHVVFPRRDSMILVGGLGPFAPSPSARILTRPLTLKERIGALILARRLRYVSTDTLPKAWPSEIPSTDGSQARPVFRLPSRRPVVKTAVTPASTSLPVPKPDDLFLSPPLGTSPEEPSLKRRCVEGSLGDRADRRAWVMYMTREWLDSLVAIDDTDHP